MSDESRTATLDLKTRKRGVVPYAAIEDDRQMTSLERQQYNRHDVSVTACLIHRCRFLIHRCRFLIHRCCCVICRCRCLAVFLFTIVFVAVYVQNKPLLISPLS